MAHFLQPVVLDDVLCHFRAIIDDPGRKRSLLFCNTLVTFVDPWGEPEEGIESF